MKNFLIQLVYLRQINNKYIYLYVIGVFFNVARNFQLGLIGVYVALISNPDIII